MDVIGSAESDPRVTLRRNGPPDHDGRCVVYWMRRSLRAIDNPAIDLQVRLSNALGKPCVVFFGLVPVANANLRHYTFLAKSFGELQAELARHDIGFVLRCWPNDIVGFCQEVRPALLITDENPLRGPEKRLGDVVRKVRIPVWSVDADVVVPSKLISGKQYAARIVRPKLLKLQNEFLVSSKNPKAKIPWSSKVHSLSPNETSLDGHHIDRSVQPVRIESGAKAAVSVLRSFVRDRLAAYPKLRNHPETYGTSGLSPYLHYGQISPVRIALEVQDSGAPKTAKEAFLDQLITWRELAVNFVRHNELYDSIECAEPWAQRSLAKHASDKRPLLYNERQLENAETYDPLWNAAQVQMVERGWMHNYMRM